MTPSYCKKVDFIQNAEYTRKNGPTWPISLFVYYNSSDHQTKIFLYSHGLQVPTIVMIQGFVWKDKIDSKHLPNFGEKTRWSDKIRPRAAGVVRRKKITFSLKTRFISKDVEKKSLSKNSKNKYQIRKYKSQPTPCFP